MNKQFNVALDIKKPLAAASEIEVVEGDNGNKFVITVKDGANAVDLTGCRVIAVFLKTNGTSSQDSGTVGSGIVISAATITIDLHTGSFSPGIVTCELQIYSGTDLDTLLTTAQFSFKCRKALMDEATLESSNEYPQLISLIDDVNGLHDDYEQIIIGNGDMRKSEYDTNNSGVVDNAEKLGGQLPEYYAQSSRGLPPSGAAGKVLKKTSAADYDAEWGDVQSLPAGGSAGSVLAKADASDYAAGWIDTLPIANGGTGAADQAAALSALLGASAVPITNGGTGATTAAAARSALGFGLFQFLERKWVSAGAVLTLDTQMQSNPPVIYVLTLMQLSSGVYSPFVYIINHRESNDISATNVAKVTQTDGSFPTTAFTVSEYNTNQLQITASAATYFSASLFAITSYQ